MRITLVGPGRAGTAVALAAVAAGHEISAVVARRPSAAADAAAALGATALALGDPFPGSDLLILGVRDDAIGQVAGEVADAASGIPSAVHLSGLAPVGELQPLQIRGLAVGSFHPLQTLPTPEAGARRLPGAWIAVTSADIGLRESLWELASSMGARPFDLEDAAKPLYHAAAAAAANFPLAALAMASDLFDRAGVPFEAAGPLVSAVVANAFELGPRAALTGPVARGDVGTIERQLEAVATDAPEWLDAFRAFVGELAQLTGRAEQFRRVGGDGPS